MDPREIINKMSAYDFANGTHDADIAAGVAQIREQEDAEWRRMFDALTIDSEVVKLKAARDFLNKGLIENPSPHIILFLSVGKSVLKFNKRKKQRRATCGRRRK